MEKILDEFLNYSNIIRVKKDRNYWLVRTNSGKNFQDFHLGDFIAIGNEDLELYDEIDTEIIKKENLEELKKVVNGFDPDHKRPGIIVNHLDRFVNQMKKGDIILSPSENSSYIAFGEILDDEIYEISDKEFEELYEDNRCYFKKRRKVNWLKIVEKENLDLYLHKLLNSHYAVTDANTYSHYIDRSLYNFFIKDDQLHIVFEVRKRDHISAVEILNFINNVIKSIDVFNDLYEKNYDKNKVDMKINVQSPGPIEFSSSIIQGLIIAIAVIAIVGGKFKFKKGDDYVEGEFESAGLIKRLEEFYTAVKNKRLEEKEKNWTSDFKDSSENLKIDIPEIEDEKEN